MKGSFLTLVQSAIVMAFLFADINYFFQNTESLSFKRTQQIMGTLAQITLTVSDSKENFPLQKLFWLRQTQRAFQVMKDLDQLLSLYLPHSELSQLNQKGFLREAHPDLLFLIRKSFEIQKETGGAFDPTLASLTMGAYHFNQLNVYSSNQLPLPNSHEIIQALKLHGSSFIQIKGKTIRITRRGVGLDFGGIAKGYAVDRAAEILFSPILLQAEINLSGDIRCFKKCYIVIRNPMKPQKVAAEFEVNQICHDNKNKCYDQVGISTSGGYYRYSGQQKFHHLLDPHTGLSSQSFSSVTLVGQETSADLDAWSTALAVMKSQDAFIFLQSRPELGFYLVMPSGEVKTNLAQVNFIHKFQSYLPSAK